jgi:hypothetical protein
MTEKYETNELKGRQHMSTEGKPLVNFNKYFPLCFVIMSVVLRYCPTLNPAVFPVMNFISSCGSGTQQIGLIVQDSRSNF